MPYIDLTIIEQREFIGSIMIAAQTDYFSECMEIIKMAESAGLFERVSLSKESHPEIKDLDNPIERSSL